MSNKNKGTIKGLLAEELDNSLFLEKVYAEKLKELPAETFAIKTINGKSYYYLARKVEGIVHQTYLGKLSPEECQNYQTIQAEKRKYRQQLSTVRKQIRFLKGTLRGNAAI